MGRGADCDAPSVLQYREGKGQLECWPKVQVKWSFDRSGRRAKWGGRERSGQAIQGKVKKDEEQK